MHCFCVLFHFWSKTRKIPVEKIPAYYITFISQGERGYGWRGVRSGRQADFFFLTGETDAEDVVGAVAGAASLPLPLEEQVKVIHVEGAQKAPGGKIMIVKAVRTFEPSFLPYLHHLYIREARVPERSVS